MQESDHFAALFATEPEWLEAAAAFIAEGLRQNRTGVLLATDAHRDGIELELQRRGVDPDVFGARYQYVAPAAEAMLEGISRDGSLDRDRFHDRLGLLIRQARSRGQPVSIFSELGALLVQRGEHEAALELEELWNELSRIHSFVLFCGFAAATFPDRTNDKRFKYVCSAHNHVRTPPVE